MKSRIACFCRCQYIDIFQYQVQFSLEKSNGNQMILPTQASLRMTRITQKKFSLLLIVSLVILLLYTTYRTAFGTLETNGREGKGLSYSAFVRNIRCVQNEKLRSLDLQNQYRIGITHFGRKQNFISQFLSKMLGKAKAVFEFELQSKYSVVMFRMIVYPLNHGRARPYFMDTCISSNSNTFDSSVRKPTCTK